jgi:adenine phosphoribosyltransferase
MTAIHLDDYIAAYPDFPIEGILFRDISPLLASPEAMAAAVELFYEKLLPFQPEGFAGIESRGFLFSTLMAQRFECGSFMLRKPGKLPGRLLSQSYALEYGKNELTMQADTPIAGKRIVLIDDLLATGGTVKAAKTLLESVGAEAVACAVVIHLEGLGGQDVIDMPLVALTAYD